MKTTIQSYYFRFLSRLLSTCHSVVSQSIVVKCIRSKYIVCKDFAIQSVEFINDLPHKVIALSFSTSVYQLSNEHYAVIQTYATVRTTHVFLEILGIEMRKKSTYVNKKVFSFTSMGCRISDVTFSIIFSLLIENVAIDLFPTNSTTHTRVFSLLLLLINWINFKMEIE